ncbi:MAG TPA: 5-oxoprolinase subunit PxpB [Myxococcota bacterium]|nr:5-oxoprolinase subunit PxpB [Myxococcota bacterium]
MRALRVGAHAVLLEFADPAEVRTVFLAAREARSAGQIQAVDIVPGAQTLLLDGVEVSSVLRRAETWLGTAHPEQSGDLIELPIRYDGPDLAEVAGMWGCTPGEVADRHAAIEYTVAFCGFAPGFAYCTGLPDGVQVPRRSQPRTAVPAGAVGLAGPYTGVYPRSSPGGWQLIGRVLVPIWGNDPDDPVLLKPGSRVRFCP